MVVTSKAQANFSISRELLERFNDLARPYGVKRRAWLVSAGMLLLLSADRREIEALLDKIGSAELRGDYRWLLTLLDEGLLGVKVIRDPVLETQSDDDDTAGLLAKLGPRPPKEGPGRIAASSAGSSATPDDRPEETDPDTGRPRRRR